MRPTLGIFFKTTLVVLLLGCIFVGCVLIQSLERTHRSNLRMIELMERSKATRPVTMTAPHFNESEPANARFFDKDAVNGDRIVEPIGAEPPNLNAIITNEATCASFSALCSASLADRDWENPEEFKPMLADSWEISDDHMSYRIKLRKGVFYQSYVDPDTGIRIPPKEVTSEDFKFLVDVIMNPEVNAAPLRVYYQDLEGVEIIGPHEFIVKWKKPFYGSIAATLGMSPLPRHFYWSYEGPFDAKRFNNDHKRNRMLVSCGPYTLEAWEKDRHFLFRRNPEYFGNRLGIGPKIEYLKYEMIKHPNTRLQAMIAGKVDRLGLTPDQWTNAKTSEELTGKGIAKYKYLVPQYSYIGYNQKNELFKEKKVRQALTMLVDRERIRKELLMGLAETVNGPFFVAGNYADKNLEPWPYSPERAKKLLEECGWKDIDNDGILEKDGKKFSFTMLQISNHPLQVKMLPLIKESMAAAGIEMKIRVVEWSVYIQQLENRTFDACTLGWATGFDMDLYQVWHSSQIANGGSNHISYSNPELDKLIETARTTFEPEKRLELARKMELLLHDEQPYTFLFSSYSLVGISERYRNRRVFPVGMPDIILHTPAAQQLAL